MSQFNKIASTRKDCSECLSLVLLSATTLLKIESLFNEIDRCLHRRALPPSSKLSQSHSWALIHTPSWGVISKRRGGCRNQTQTDVFYPPFLIPRFPPPV